MTTVFRSPLGRTLPAAALVLVPVLLAPPVLTAQSASLAPAGSAALVVLDARPGAALAAGGRLAWSRILALAVAEVALVRREGDSSTHWVTGPDGRECREDGSGEVVGDGLCLRTDLRLAAMVDAVLVTNRGPGLQGLVGGGYRVGDVETAYAALGVLGRLRSTGYPWQVRMLVGRGLFQLQLGISTARVGS